jgi:hypothetical protein
VESIYDRYHYTPQMRKAIDAFEEHLRSVLAKVEDRSKMLAA